MKRSNPWPAFVDLFSALLIAAFGGLMLLSAGYKHRIEQEVVVSDLRLATDRVHKRLTVAITQQQHLKARVRQCGEDTCVDLYIHFARDDDVIADLTERESLKSLGADLRRGLDEFSDIERNDVEIIVEGHADRSQPKHSDPRAAFLYNWDLSARRASSVVYEFREIGLKVPQYKIVAIGYADSQPLCTEDTPACEAQNRRTTLRLRIDTRSVEAKLKKRTGDALHEKR